MGLILQRILWLYFKAWYVSKLGFDSRSGSWFVGAENKVSFYAGTPWHDPAKRFSGKFIYFFCKLDSFFALKRSSLRKGVSKFTPNVFK